MAQKRLTLQQLQAKKLTEAQQLNTKGGYLIPNQRIGKDRIRKRKSFILEDELDIRRPVRGTVDSSF